jgi:NADH:ubiquinone oxidoreductase subunit H
LIIVIVWIVAFLSISTPAAVQPDKMVSQTWKTLLPIALVSSTVSAACSGDAWDVIVVGKEQACLS